MSVNHYTYLGPFFECVCPIVDKEQKSNACSNKLCKYHKANTYIISKFCTECGSPVDKQTFIVKGPKVNSFALYDLLEENLSLANGNYGPYNKTDTSETHLWIPNINPKNPKLPQGYKSRRFYHDEGDVKYTAFDKETISLEIDYLGMNHEKSQKILQEQYSNENVNIRWGLIQYDM